MAPQVFEYDPPERFVAGTVGEPGSRTFFLQARSGSRVTSVALEKQQVAVLAERLEELLDEVLRRSGGTAAVPAVAPSEAEDTGPLDTPILEEFRVGTMALAWEPDAEQVVVEARAIRDGEDEDEAGDAAGDAEDDGGVLRVHLSGPVARAFAKRALALVSAGRPACPFCSLPLDPSGHLCPRMNGHRR